LANFCKSEGGTAQVYLIYHCS